ncbi:hypothetical protein [Haloferula sp. A504]|uniref:hypothetical protein n=1 Tax=Haloferula sp. A504 TaxID=3373601 RepID=UPI0031C4D1C3|nr:hypothetical protein [Verrucomicrobiaceae bacterium E54]
MNDPNLVLGPLSRARFLLVSLLILIVLNVGNALSLVALYRHQAEFGLGVVPLFGFDREANFPTFFNGALLFGAAILAVGIGRARGAAKLSHPRSWLGVGAILGFLALDELCSIHDTLDILIDGQVDLSGPVNWPWVIPYALLAVGVGVVYLRFFFSLPRPTQIGFGLAAVLYVFGAIGMEMIAAAHVEKVGGEDMTYGLFFTIEENLEILACILAVDTLMAFARGHHRGLTIGVRLR